MKPSPCESLSIPRSITPFRGEPPPRKNHFPPMYPLFAKPLPNKATTSINLFHPTKRPLLVKPSSLPPSKKLPIPPREPTNRVWAYPWIPLAVWGVYPQRVWIVPQRRLRWGRKLNFLFIPVRFSVSSLILVARTGLGVFEVPAACFVAGLKLAEL